MQKYSLRTSISSFSLSEKFISKEQKIKTKQFKRESISVFKILSNLETELGRAICLHTYIRFACPQARTASFPLPPDNLSPQGFRQQATALHCSLKLFSKMNFLSKR